MINVVNFLKDFILVCQINNVDYFNIDSFIKYIFECKKNNYYNDLLSNINLNIEDIYLYSNEIDEAIFLLLKSNILRINIEDSENIYINNLNDWELDNRDEMQIFFEDFQSYIKSFSKRQLLYIS